MRYLNTTLLTERSLLWSVVFAVPALLVGLGLLYWTSIPERWQENPCARTVVRDVGSLLVVSVVITFLWQTFGKRVFADEVLAKAGIAKELSHAGIRQVTDAFHQGVDWPALFLNSDRLDIFFAYGQSWRNVNDSQLRALVSRRGALLRVALPDHENDDVVNELARRFASEAPAVRDLILEAQRYFLGLATIASERNASVEVWLFSGSPQLTFYRFANVGVVALYSHRRERTNVPTLVVERGGTLYDFISSEFKAIVGQGGLGRQVEGDQV